MKASFRNNLDHTEEIRQQVSGFKMSLFFFRRKCVLRVSSFKAFRRQRISHRVKKTRGNPVEKTAHHLPRDSCLSRWKNSFLLSLVFGLPAMGLMIYMMVMDSQHQEHGGSMPQEQNLLPGLSLLNLAFFLLCTPVQVGPRVCVRGFFYLCFLPPTTGLFPFFIFLFASDVCSFFFKDLRRPILLHPGVPLAEAPHRQHGRAHRVGHLHCLHLLLRGPGRSHGRASRPEPRHLFRHSAHAVCVHRAGPMAGARRKSKRM